MVSTPGRLRNVINKLIEVKPEVLEAVVNDVRVRKLLPLRGRMLSAFLENLVFALKQYDDGHVLSEQEQVKMLIESLVKAQDSLGRSIISQMAGKGLTTSTIDKDYKPLPPISLYEEHKDLTVETVTKDCGTALYKEFETGTTLFYDLLKRSMQGLPSLE